MKGGTRPLGYTIVEVIIVLAVSGLMFIIAANFISGKQQRTAFTQGTNEFTAQVQGTIDQVIDGQYTDVAFTCVSNGSQLTINAAALKKANPSCIFLGKFMHFGEGGKTNRYETFSLAADRTAPDYDHALITPILSSSVWPPDLDLTSHKAVPQSLDIVKVTATNGGTTYNDIQGIGFIQGLGTTDVNGYVTGSQGVTMVYAPGLTAGKDEQNAKDALTHSGMSSPLSKIDTARICLSDGTRFARVTLGGDTSGSASQLSAKLKVVNSVDEC